MWEEDEAALDPCPRPGNPVYAHMPALQFCSSLIEYTYDGWPGLEEAGAKRQEGGMGGGAALGGGGAAQGGGGGAPGRSI